VCKPIDRPHETSQGHSLIQTRKKSLAIVNSSAEEHYSARAIPEIDSISINTSEEVEPTSENSSVVKVVSSEIEADKQKTAGFLFAAGLLSNVVLLAIVFALLATSNRAINVHTWVAIDNIVAIFLAVMYFQAFNDLLKGSFLHVANAKVLCTILHTVALLLVTLVISWLARGQPIFLAVFTGVAAHYVAFVSVHMAHTLYVEYTTGSVFMKVAMLFLLILLFTLIGFLVYKWKKTLKIENEVWNEKATDLENDCMAMACAVAWTLLVGTLLTGKDAVMKLDTDEQVEHSSRQRTILLIYGFSLLPIGASLLVFADEPRESSHVWKRLLMFFRSFISMACAWALLLWGQWTFYEQHSKDNPILGRTIFAIIASVAVAAGIVVSATLTHRSDEGGSGQHAVKRGSKVVLISLALVVAWSWEQTIDAAIEATAVVESSDEVHHWNLGKSKFIIAFCMSAILIPIYAIYLKPIVVRESSRRM
jgi:hypothetical protein